MGLIWLSPKNIIYYCPGCSKSVAIVGSVKNLLSCSGTHSKGLHAGLIASKSIHNYSFKGYISLKTLKLWLPTTTDRNIFLMALWSRVVNWITKKLIILTADQNTMLSKRNKLQDRNLQTQEKAPPCNFISQKKKSYSYLTLKPFTLILI